LVDRRLRSAKENEQRSCLETAEAWTMRREIVAAGLPSEPDQQPFMPHKHAGACRDYVVEVIGGQIKYHERVNLVLHVTVHRLHRLTYVAFGLTFLAVIAHFFLHAEWLLLFTAALPALGAAIHGVVSANEMERVASMSRAIAERLQQTVVGLEKIRFSDEAAESMAWLRMRSLASRAAHVMSDTNRQWQELIELRATGLPG
jgi:hypothetical protein